MYNKTKGTLWRKEMKNGKLLKCNLDNFDVSND